MARIVTPGLVFTVAPMPYLDPPMPTLYPTASTYGLVNLEDVPKRNELYVVCQDGSIQSVHEPDRPIGWELIEDGLETYYRVTQMNHKRKRCAIWFHSRTEAPPAGRGFIGSVVTFERRIVDRPQDAEMTEAQDPGDEVTSAVREYIEDFGAAAAAVDTTQLTDDLGTIASINPLLAQCAVVLGDPDQTEAMARFAEGGMSYAEMRARCG